MKLLFFTPAVRRSAIGRMSASVVRDLVAQRHEVTVVRTEAKSKQTNQTHDFNTTMISWHELEKKESLLKSVDQTIYQIGNNYEFHEGCLQWMPKRPGIVCLHDFYLGHLFVEWAQSRRAQAGNILKFWYGEAIARSFFEYAAVHTFVEDTRLSAPMTEWICSQATGVVTHSGWGSDRVLASCPGPVHVVPLAYEIDGPAPLSKNPTKKERLQLLTIGHINPNKRVAVVIEAIGSNEKLRNRISYCLVGAIQPNVREALSALANECGVDLQIAGEVNDAALATALAECDVVCCLRWPALESGSASAIEAMLFGKAVICTDTGFYSEIPDDLVVKISIESEQTDLVSSLLMLLEDDNLVETLGNSAQNWASQTFNASSYSTSLVAMSVAALEANPVIEACKSFSEILSNWSENSFTTPSFADIDALKILSGEPTGGASSVGPATERE